LDELGALAEKSVKNFVGFLAENGIALKEYIPLEEVVI